MMYAKKSCSTVLISYLHHRMLPRLIGASIPVDRLLQVRAEVDHQAEELLLAEGLLPLDEARPLVQRIATEDETRGTVRDVSEEAVLPAGVGVRTDEVAKPEGMTGAVVEPREKILLLEPDKKLRVQLVLVHLPRKSAKLRQRSARQLVATMLLLQLLLLKGGKQAPLAVLMTRAKAMRSMLARQGTRTPSRPLPQLWLSRRMTTTRQNLSLCKLELVRGLYSLGKQTHTHISSVFANQNELHAARQKSRATAVFDVDGELVMGTV